MYKRPELDTKNPPGQIVNPIPKQECEKLTFDQWWEKWYAPYPVGKMDLVEVAEYVWKAAQENK